MRRRWGEYDETDGRVDRAAVYMEIYRTEWITSFFDSMGGALRDLLEGDELWELTWRKVLPWSIPNMTADPGFMRAAKLDTHALSAKQRTAIIEAALVRAADNYVRRELGIRDETPRKEVGEAIAYSDYTLGISFMQLGPLLEVTMSHARCELEQSGIEML